MTQKILILGGTGMFVVPTVNQFKADGFQVRLLVRDTAKSQKLFDDSFEIVQGDVTDLASLEKAMEACNGVHISVGGPVDRISAENVAALAPKLGVERVSYISGATVAEKNRWFPMVAQKLDAEKAIQACGVPYTIFCPTWPMEQLPRFARNGNPSLMGKQLLPVHFFAAEDLACMVSKAYQFEEAQNKHFYVYGPEAMSIKTALERYCARFHPEVEKISVMPIWMAKLLGTLTGNEILKFASGLMGYFDKTAETGNPSEANQILGAPETTLEAWMDTLVSNLFEGEKDDNNGNGRHNLRLGICSSIWSLNDLDVNAQKLVTRAGFIFDCAALFTAAQRMDPKPVWRFLTGIAVLFSRLCTFASQCSKQTTIRELHSF